MHQKSIAVLMMYRCTLHLPTQVHFCLCRKWFSIFTNAISGCWLLNAGPWINARACCQMLFKSARTLPVQWLFKH